MSYLCQEHGEESRIWENYSDVRIAVAGRAKDTFNYENALAEFGAESLTTMNTGGLDNCDGLLLPGGGDITPAFFGQENQGSRNIDVELDITQLQALELFIKWKKPVLGICKGMQIINVFFGGSILQDLPGTGIHAWNGADRYHPVSSVEGSVPALLYGSGCVVNSAHHQGIGKPGKGLLVTQFSPDRVAEGIAHDRLPVLGVQWHPERLFASGRPYDAVSGRPLFDYFLSLCRG